MLHNSHPSLFAIVGMPGSGKSETALFLEEIGFSRVRFGDVTEEGLKGKNLPITPETEETYRLEMRKELGMAAYAIKSERKIKKLLEENKHVVIDGLYSWEEFLYLKERFPQLKLVHIFARPEVRYERLSVREVRPFTREESRKRDISEIENLNKGGPIAMADYQIVNESDRDELHKQIERIVNE